jgi:hypothetical protein
MCHIIAMALIKENFDVKTMVLLVQVNVHTPIVNAKK